MNRTTLAAVSAAALILSGTAHAQIVHNYENLDEGFLGTTYSADGITYRDVNNVSGTQPDGTNFEPGELGSQLIVEDATLLYDDFTSFGSPVKGLTFGSAFVPGTNLSIGALASVFIDVPLANAASLQIAFYENGPWGGINYHLDAIHNGQVVASDSFVIADGGGRDNVATSLLSVAGAQFSSLHLYATLNGVYTAPRGMIDDLTVQPVPEPATLAALGLGAFGLVRRRRSRVA